MTRVRVAKKRKESTKSEPSSNKGKVGVPEWTLVTDASFQDRVNNFVSSLCSEGYELMLVVVKVTEGSGAPLLKGSRLGIEFMDKNPTILNSFQDFCKRTIQGSGSESQAGVTVVPDLDDNPVPAAEEGHIMVADVSEASSDTSHDVASVVDVQETERADTEMELDASVDNSDEIFDKGKEVDDIDSISYNVTHRELSHERDISQMSPQPEDGNARIDGQDGMFIDFLKDDQSQDLQLFKESSARNGIVANLQDSKYQYVLDDVIYKIENLSSLIDELHQDSEKPGIYFCFFCEKQFESKIKVVNHVTLHAEQLQQPLTRCHVCHMILSARLMVYHDAEHAHQSRNIPVGIAAIKRDVRNDIAYIYTRLMFRGDEMKPCAYCGYTSGSIDSLKRHYITQHSRMYFCTLCNLELPGYKHISKHMRSHKSLKSRKKSSSDINVSGSFVCPFSCGSSFNSLPLLKGHFTKCHEKEKEKLISCELCVMFFTDKVSFEDHQVNHADEEFSCRACSTKFYTREKLASHRLEHKLQQKNKNYLCSVCGKVFKKLQQLDIHVAMRHRGETPIKCDTCDSVFTHKISLERHKAQVHLDNWPYVCEICGERFKISQRLWKHKLKHSDKKRFQCQTCLQGFTRKNSLEVHLVNTGHFSETQPESSIKYVHCEDCGRKFANNGQLYRHRQNHHGQLKACSICDRKFKDNSNLHIHMRIHTNTRPTCTVCHIVFRSQKRLTDHMAVTHAEYFPK